MQYLISLVFLLIISLSGNAYALTHEVPISTFRSIFIKASIDEAEVILGNPTKMLELFPNLDQIVRLDERNFGHVVKPLGPAGFAHSVRYSAEYRMSKSDSSVTISWTPSNQRSFEANSEVSGVLHLIRLDESTLKLTLRMEGILRDVRAPAIFAGLARSAAKGIFDDNARSFLKELKVAIESHESRRLTRNCCEPENT